MQLLFPAAQNSHFSILQIENVLGLITLISQLLLSLPVILNFYCAK